MCMHIDTWNKPAMRVGALLSQAGDIAQKEIEEAKERMAKFAPGGPGTEQVFFFNLLPGVLALSRSYLN
jgi:hypothetical protein